MNDIPFLPTTTKYEPETLVSRLESDYSQNARAINIRDIGVYSTGETRNGQAFQIGTTTHEIYRKLVDCGALPNATNKSVAHGITFLSTAMITRVYGVAKSASAGGIWLPLPYSTPAALNQQIAITVNAANVVITTGINWIGYNTSYVVLEYWQV
jgi:hypothetical protein